MRTRNVITAAIVVSTGALFASGAIKALFSANYLPHRYCYLAQPGLIWSNVTADLVTAASYLAIFSTLFWLANKFRHLPELRRYLWILASFGVFILACGATHVMETVTIWWPVYRLSVFIKAVTATVSAATAIYLFSQAGNLAVTVRHIYESMASEKVQAEALRKSKALLDRAGSLIGVGGWEIDLANGRITWSTETYRILGAALDHEPVLDDALKMYPDEARLALSNAIELASNGGPGWDMELPVVRSDGRHIWIRVVGVAEPGDGTPVRLSGAFQDITNRIDERLALRMANERVILAADSGGIGIWDWDIVEKTFVCDAWIYRLHGLEFQASPAPLEFWTENIHSDDRADVVQALHDAVDGTRPYETDFRVIWKDGTVHRLKATGHVTRDEAGRAVRMVGTNRDITESRRLVADLAEQHELLRVTLQSIGEGVITKDAYRNIAWMNAVAERLTGWSNAEALGRPVTEIFTAVDEQTRLAQDTQSALFPVGGKAVISTKPVLLVSRDGSECVIESSAYPLRNARQDLLGSVLVFRDVTEQRNLTLETQHVTTLQLELKLKDQFLSHVSHELRSPLTSIYSFSSIIADDLAGGTTPEQQEFLQIILKNVVQLQAMIEDLLTVTQSREGKLTLDLQSVSVSDAITEAVSTIQGAAAQKHIHLSSIDSSDLPPAYADPTRLRQVLIILIDNAVKFTPPGGQITVQASRKADGFLLLQVSDTGCGIAPENRTRVFESLYQVPGPNEPDTSQAGRIGLGLGLHIARNLVTMQGGFIWITGAPNQGSTFNFSLPIFGEAFDTPTTENHPKRRKTDPPQAALPSLPAAA
jgi:PAS domain S-box-containing protein